MHSLAASITCLKIAMQKVASMYPVSPPKTRLLPSLQVSAASEFHGISLARTLLFLILSLSEF